MSDFKIVVKKSTLRGWSELPQELLDLISNNLHSNVELIRIRSICKPWRAAVSTAKKRFHNRYNNNKRILSPFNQRKCALSPAYFLRVVLSSNPDQGWIVKTQDVYEYGNELLSPLTRDDITSSEQAINLLDYTVSEIRQSQDIRYLEYSNNKMWCNFARVISMNDVVYAVCHYDNIWCCKNGDKVWKRIKDEEVEKFCDLIVHKGQIYALDLNGATWWISKSELNIYQFGPPTPMDEYDINLCKDKRFVEWNGDLCIVHRFGKKFCEKRGDITRTMDFKVYKMDEELVEWVEVKSLGDKAFVMAADSCFSVLASEYYGCLENAIYFTDEEKRNNVKVFKLGDGSITMKSKMMESEYQSCFQMFSPPFA